MHRHLSFDFSGIPLRLRLDDADVARRFETDWRRFLSADAPEPLLDMLAQIGGAPAPEGPLQTLETTAELRPGAARFSSPEGAIEVQLSGLALSVRAPAPPERQFWTLVNLICAALAWRLPSRGALLLHGAAIVLDDRAFVLVGPAGSGKTTWADSARAAGARYLSDDLTVVDTTGAEVAVLATPIRGDDPEPQPPGRFALAALLLPAHGAPPRLAPVSALAASARVAANLPFVAEWLERDERIGAALSALCTKARTYELTFAPDRAFVEHLRELA
jgi:hypothetical protein